MKEKEIYDKLNGFITNNNYKIIKTEEKYCEMEATITETSLNPYKMPHGGFIFGLADTAAGIAAFTTKKEAVTVNASIDYLHSAKGNKLKAIAKNIKDGKNITVYEVFIYDENETLVAKSSITYFYIN